MTRRIMSSALVTGSALKEKQLIPSTHVIKIALLFPFIIFCQLSERKRGDTNLSFVLYCSFPTTSLSSQMGKEADNQSNGECPPPNELEFIPIGHPDTMMSKESVRRAVEEFQVRPSDIMVATFPKTGTTLVTWMCHQLRTGGDVNFETLYEVVPWPALSWDIGYDPNVDGSQFTPRVFKSHLRMASIYRGCKYVVTVRNPAKTALSFYNFFLAKQVPLALEMEVSEFVMDTPFVKGREGRASLWEYYREYHILLNCPSVLILVYEDLVKDMPSSIRMLAKFMGIDASPELIQNVTDMSTKEFMAQHMSKFDEPYERAKKLGRAGDLSQLAPGAKIAVSPHPQKFNDEANQFLADQWKQTMTPLGYADYQSFASIIRETNKKRW